jgi:hypothetical protein
MIFVVMKLMARVIFLDERHYVQNRHIFLFYLFHYFLSCPWHGLIAKFLRMASICWSSDGSSERHE